ncbi:hypothetical protein P3X46_003826 [Hevea brasiliensis]|uniref:Peptidase M24 domain-containing protein n=1 Tax=Hevea brasiliensis TaxID=3981 RepID=A0ABQ9NB77_HEVBR|nr:hypothetical protein P3X46_003826 [Hevea brasiliensis]
MPGGSDEAVATALSCVQCGKPALLHYHTGLLPGEQDLGGLNEGWLYCLQRGQTPTPKLPHFDWTGTLRPYLISPMRVVPAHIDQPDWAVDIKSPDQIQRMRETCRIAREVLDAASQVRRPGVTADEIDRVVHEATIAAGGYPSPLNYNFFPKSCCDLNETYRVGNVDEASCQLVQCTFECLEKAISIEVINRHATMSGSSVVKSYCGHRIGELFHCAPNIPHYGRNKAVGVMKAGQTFTIEPMINAGVWRDQMWPDGWTAVTADGKRSAQFEHALLVTETGVEVLTARLLASPSVFPWLPSSPSVFHG